MKIKIMINNSTIDFDVNGGDCVEWSLIRAGQIILFNNKPVSVMSAATNYTDNGTVEKEYIFAELTKDQIDEITEKTKEFVNKQIKLAKALQSGLVLPKGSI